MRKTKTLNKIPYPAPDVTTKVIPAPTEGWDAISPLADMSPQRAPIMDNLVPRPGYIETRKGYITHVTSTLGSPIETLMVYEQPATVTMYAADATGRLLNVTASATAANVVVATVFTTGQWEWINYTPAGADTVLMFTNHINGLYQVSGTVISSVIITNLSIATSIANTSAFRNIAAVKRRIWFVIKQSTKAAFLATDAIAGPLAGFQDFGALWTKGGYLVDIGNWTIDGGSGPDDYTVFISNRGQLTVFQGTDPTSSNWTLKGTFDVAPPIGNRCFYKFGSDLLIITQQGVLPISQVLPFDPAADRSAAITLRIQNAMLTAATEYSANFGWELISYPPESLLFLNIPVVNDAGTKLPEQYVMNTIIGSWCRFTGWYANTFAFFNSRLYFGDTTGNVRWAYQGGLDGTESIDGTLQCAFNWYDTPGRLKRMTLIQPLLTLINGALTPTLGVDVDFGNNAVPSPVSTGVPTSVWDQALWDVGFWMGIINTSTWLSVNALGKALAVRLELDYETDTNEDPPALRINAFNTIVEMGGMI